MFSHFPASIGFMSASSYALAFWSIVLLSHSTSTLGILHLFAPETRRRVLLFIKVDWTLANNAEDGRRRGRNEGLEILWLELDSRSTCCFARSCGRYQLEQRVRFRTRIENTGKSFELRKRLAAVTNTGISQANRSYFFGATVRERLANLLSQPLEQSCCFQTSSFGRRRAGQKCPYGPDCREGERLGCTRPIRCECPPLERLS